MSDDGEALDSDFDPVTSLAGPLMRKVLDEVARERQRQDGDLGFFRDYLDGTAGRVVSGPTRARVEQARTEAMRRLIEANRTGRTTWVTLLEDVTATLVAADTEREIRGAALSGAALLVSWVEAIDRRKDEKRIERKMRPSRWSRVRAWFRGLFRMEF